MRLLAVLCLCAALALPCAAAAQPLPAATLPPGLPAAVGAPQAVLPQRLYAPDARTLTWAACWGEDAVVSGQRVLADASLCDALWHVELSTGVWTLLYEARRGVQILTPVYCAGTLYWAEGHEDQPDGWYIRRWDAQKRRAVLVREDAYRRSALVPVLHTDGEQVYWYESGEAFAQEPPYQRLRTTLYALIPGGRPRVVSRQEMPIDWLPPRIQQGTYAASGYEDGQWRVRVTDARSGLTVAETQVSAMPMDVRSDGRYAVWRQGVAWDEAMLSVPDAQDEAELAWQAHAEEDWTPGGDPAGGGMGGQLWLWDLEAEGAEPVRIDVQADALTLCAEGVYYVTESHVLCLYSFSLGRVLRLTPHADYLPTLWAAGDRLLTLRAMDDGQEQTYRLAVLDVRALQAVGWPPLQ